MNCETLLGLLGPIASERLQRRFIVEATREQYCVPEELLEDARQVFSHPLLAPEQRHSAVFLKFEAVLEEEAERVFVPGESARELVENNVSWSRIRQAARTLLLELGCDLSTWESK